AMADARPPRCSLPVGQALARASDAACGSLPRISKLVHALDCPPPSRPALGPGIRRRRRRRGTFRAQPLRRATYPTGAGQPEGIPGELQGRLDFALAPLLHDRRAEARPGADATRCQREAALLLRGTNPNRPALAEPDPQARVGGDRR